jgi:flagellar motor protein MotB
MGARPAAGVPMSEAAAIAEARRRAAFSPGQQVGLILFEHGSASLAPADRTLLQRIAVLARQNGAVVRVVGHASGRTGEMDGVRHLNRNLNISEARATAAAAELNAAGLPAERIVIEAKGDSEPIYSEAMPSGEAGNRRVEVYLQ